MRSQNKLVASNSQILDLFHLQKLEQIIVLTTENISIQHLKERIQFGVLLNNHKLPDGNFFMDRIVPLPGFDFDYHPYVLINKDDIMDISSGDIVSKLSNLGTYQPFGTIEGTQLLMTYNDDVLSLHEVTKAGFAQALY